MSYGLSLQHVPTYRLSAFRYFLPQERHITRVDCSDILLILLDGTLRFTEDGIPVELSRGSTISSGVGFTRTVPRSATVRYTITCISGMGSGARTRRSCRTAAGAIPIRFCRFCGNWTLPSALMRPPLSKSA